MEFSPLEFSPLEFLDSQTFYTYFHLKNYFCSHSKHLTKKFLYLIVFAFLWSVGLFAQKTKNQSREQLENQRVSILEEIKRTQDELVLLRQDKKASLSQLQALQTKLEARQSLISNINNEIAYIEDNIKLANKDVVVMKTQLDTLRKQYAEMVRYTYKNRTSSDMIVFLFSASSFNDAIRRLQYVKQYRSYRADQAVKITSASKQLSNKITVLNLEKQKKDFVLQAQEQQNKILEAETAEKDKVVTELKGKEKDLLDGLAKKKRAAEELNRVIANAIKQEIELARKRVMEERMRLEKLRKQQEETARKNEALRKAQEQALAEKQRKQELQNRLDLAKKQQEEKERQALLDKQKREESERKLAAERKQREDKEKALAMEKQQRIEAEQKASQMAAAQRKEQERKLAIEKEKQDTRQKLLADEKKRQEQQQQQLLAQKQQQEEDQRRLDNEKRKQERELARANSDRPIGNPRYIKALAEKPKYDNVTLNTGSSDNYVPANKPVAATTEVSVPKSKVKTFESDDYKFSLTPEERQITNGLEANKGRLPWPVDKGYVIEKFGKNKHPLFNIVTENYGVDIKTNRAAAARTIFAGEVNSVTYIPGMGQTVIINHGSFFTVYSKLSKVNVAKGSHVSMKQTIGTVMTDDDGNTQVHFEIWKVGANGSPFRMNPEQWIAQ